MILVTLSHFSHIKVTVGDVKGGGSPAQSFLFKTLAYLAFTSASGGWIPLLQDWGGRLLQRTLSSAFVGAPVYFYLCCSATDP